MEFPGAEAADQSSPIASWELVTQLRRLTRKKLVLQSKASLDQGTQNSPGKNAFWGPVHWDRRLVCCPKDESLASSALRRPMHRLQRLTRAIWPEHSFSAFSPGQCHGSVVEHVFLMRKVPNSTHASTSKVLRWKRM